MTVLSPQSATVSRVATSTTTAALFAASGSTIRGRAIFNESSTVLYVKFGATATATDYTVQIGAGGYYELPMNTYGGVVHGILPVGAAASNAQCTSW